MFITITCTQYEKERFSFHLHQQPTTFYAEENSTSEAKGSINGILKHLIQIFGGVDIILICSYSIVFIIDRQRQQNTLQSENETIYVSENNLLYDDIEIIVSPDG